MKGKILELNPDSRQGVISGDDGQRYHLDIQEWKGAVLPRVDSRVDFVARGNRAEGIYPETPASSVSSKKITAALFAFFLGTLGAHKFYLGYPKQGLIMLSVFLLGFVFFGFPSVVIGIIAFIEFVIYLTKSDQEFEQTYLIGRKPWF